MDTTKAITHISLCSGYEGIGLGLRRVLPNLREIAFVEREGFPVANLVAKMEAGELDSAPIFTDVKQFPYGKFRGQVDILSGGFPCQPFSAAGKRQATEDPRHLFPYIAEGIRECQPRICFLENVQGILSCKTNEGEPVLQYVLRTLEELGYRATAGIFSASEVGAPHQRKRVFILGMADCESVRSGGRIASRQSGVDADRSEATQEGQTTHDLRSEAERCGGELRGELGNAKHMRESQPQGGEQDKRGRTQHPSEELANSNNDGHRENSRGDEEKGRVSQERWSEVCGGLSNRTGEKLGNSKHDGSSECSEKARGEVRESQQGGMQESQRGSNATSELANSNHEGLEGYQCHSSSEQGEPIQADTWSACGTRWPARPGEPQYEWEEPRVVEHSTGGRFEERESKTEQKINLSNSDRQAEPELGGASNGFTSRVDATANRVDRLRLLGNGVVNQTAAKAFVTLINRII